MIRCPTCSHENDEFATVCAHCKGFLQNRVPNLNFFETVWGILESPRTTFRTITLAEHKNYSLFLFSSFGIAISFAAFYYLKLGMFFDSLLDLIPWALGVGISFGLITSLPLSFALHRTARAMGSRRKFRHSFAVTAYSTVPILLSIVLVLPIELMTFGMYLFTSNPHPVVIKPASFYLLTGLDAVLVLWSVVLMILGTSVAHGLRFTRAFVPVAGLAATLTGFLVVVARILPAVLAGE